MISAFLLTVTGASAVYGGILLVTDPTGWKLGFHTGMLQHSPFEDFLFPGLILLILIGFGSLTVSALAIIRVGRYPTWIIFMGFAIAIWISIQVLMIREVHLLQILFALTGIVLVLLGIKERRKQFEG